MDRPVRSANDPFETLVELTAAAVSRRPPPEHLYEPLAVPLGQRIAGFLDRVLLPHGATTNDVPAANDEALHRFYY